MARDWLKTLHRSSYKGVAFWVERDAEAGSRRIVVHEFPMRDDPYLEDLGEGRRDYRVTAYVASDAADTEANALLATCATRGAGVLVLPTVGPVLVRAIEFERAHEKDRLGFAALELKFVREGFSSALATVASLANLLHVAAGGLVTAAAAFFAQAAAVTNVPDYVAASATSGLEQGFAALEAIRSSQPVDAAVSAAQRSAIQEGFAAASEAIASEEAIAIEQVAADVGAIAQALADGLPAASAVAAFEQLLASVPAQVVVAPGSRWQVSVARNGFAGNTLTRLAALAAYCSSIERMTLSDRQAGITLRANVAEFFDEQLGALDADDYTLFAATLILRDATIDYLSRTILDLAPVATVTANLSMPSLWWSWRLYADPERSEELVARNRIVHPSFMPTRFEALTR